MLFTASDGRLTSKPARVELVVQRPNTAPVVQLQPRTPVDEGQRLPGSGALVDPDEDTWTATVDHGDGTGVQPLPLTGKAFSLDHGYVRDGRYTVTVVVDDGRGGTGRATAEVEVRNAAPVVVLTGPVPGAQTTTGSTVEVTGTFTDAGLEDVHTATAVVGGRSVPATVDRATRQVRASVVVDAPGVHAVRLTVTDDAGAAGSADRVGDQPAHVVVTDPASPVSATGGGWVTPAAGSCSSGPCGRATFGFVVQDEGSAGLTGSFEVAVQGGWTLKSTRYEWAAASPAGGLWFRGRGRIDGRDATFLVTAVDGKPDRIRVRVWDAAGRLVLDNQRGAPDTASPQALGSGSVVVRRRG